MSLFCGRYRAKGVRKMLTPYGKLVRKHRIDLAMTLREMANATGVTPAFISATETGRKPVPKELLERIMTVLDLDMEQRVELKSAAEASRKSLKVELGERASGQDREVAAMFARQFPDLSEDDKDAIRRILEGRRA